MSELYEFPTPLHSLANKHYNAYPDITVDNVNFILCRIDERQLGLIFETYSNGTQFTRDSLLREQWNELYPDPDEQLSGLQEDILLFLLNMYACEKAKKIRISKIKRGKV